MWLCNFEKKLCTIIWNTRTHFDYTKSMQHGYDEGSEPQSEQLHGGELGNEFGTVCTFAQSPALFCTHDLYSLGVKLTGLLVEISLSEYGQNARSIIFIYGNMCRSYLSQAFKGNQLIEPTKAIRDFCTCVVDAGSLGMLATLMERNNSSFIAGWLRKFVQLANNDPFLAHNLFEMISLFSVFY